MRRLAAALATIQIPADLKSRAKRAGSQGDRLNPAESSTCLVKSVLAKDEFVLQLGVTRTVYPL
jgi:hypothetical protein